jgi:hypothetical protein
MVVTPPAIANALYREVLARQLTSERQASLPEARFRWTLPDGRLDMAALVEAFREWWRENADSLREGQGMYREAAPHIAFMAFLQRLVSGGGRIFRECTSGRLWAEERTVAGRTIHLRGGVTSWGSAARRFQPRCLSDGVSSP